MVAGIGFRGEGRSCLFNGNDALTHTNSFSMPKVMASDFAIAQFRFLVKLMLVHGHWSYDRIANMILYFFYKNSCLVWVIFYFQLFAGFSGQPAIEQVGNLWDF